MSLTGHNMRRRMAAKAVKDAVKAVKGEDAVSQESGSEMKLSELEAKGIDKMKKDELKFYAKEKFGADLDGKVAEMRDKLKELEAPAETELEVEDDEIVPEQPAEEGMELTAVEGDSLDEEGLE